MVKAASAAAKRASRSSVTKSGRNCRINRCRADQRLDIVGIERQGPFEKAARLRHVFRGRPLVQASHALEIQVHRIGMQRTFRSPRLSLDELGIQRVGEPRYDFVLHVEQIGDGLVEPLGPKVIAGFGVDQLHVHPKPVAATLHRAFEHVADVQLAADLLEINRFAFVGECGVSADDERAADARQVRGQALGHAIDEIVLLGIAAEIGERQHNDGKTRR